MKRKGAKNAKGGDLRRARPGQKLDWRFAPKLSSSSLLGVLCAFAFQSFWLAAASAQPVVVSPRPDAVSVTLYREGGMTSRQLQTDPAAADRGLVMVTETRTVTLPAGPSRITFRGVADGMLAQTAAVGGIDVAESDFDYDLLTPGALAARSIGERVRLVRTDPATGRATERRGVIRSAPQGVVIAFDDGTFEAPGCSGLPEKLVFDRVPAGLADRPTLSVRTRGGAGGRRTIRLSYLATGLAWSADYVARLSPDGRTLDLTGWLTLANSGDTTFGAAPTDVVAGTLNREQVAAIQPTLLRREDRCWPRPIRWGREMLQKYERVFVTASRGQAMYDMMAMPASVASPPPPPAPPPPPMARQSELGDYKLYTLPEPTTVAARQVKQVAFLDQRSVPVERVLEVRLAGLPMKTPVPAAVILRMRNARETGLGQPLPAGSVVVMRPARDGRLRYAGRDTIEDNAVGLPFELELGRAFEVHASYTQVTDERLSPTRVRRAAEVELTNAGSGVARMELRGMAWRGLAVVTEDAPHTEKDGAPLWTLDLAPNGRRLFRYTVEHDG